ncbi:MAG: AraC family transcriptional regulator [Terricaulis sp.]
MIATLTGMGSVLCTLLLALLFRKPKRVLGDDWLAVWLGLYLIYFITFAAMQAALGAMMLTALALVGQSAVVLLALAQFLHTWMFTAGPARKGFLFMAPALLLIVATLTLPLLFQFRVESGALIVDAPPWFALAPPLALLVTMAYPAAALSRLNVYRTRLKQRLSDLHASGLAWTRAWAWSTIALLVVQAGVFIVSLTGLLTVPLHIALLICAQVAQVAYVGWRGVSQTQVFFLDNADEFTAPDQSDLAEARADFAALRHFVTTEEPHVDGALTAGDLADRMGWARFRLTRALQLGGETNFHDFMNRARIETVKRLATEPRHARATLLALALDAGFGSKSAFYSAFHAAEGMSPARWRASQGHR